MKTELLGIPFDNLTREQTLSLIADRVEKRRQTIVHTVNVDHVILAHDDPSFRDLILASDIVTADGMPLIWLSKMAGSPLKERVTGADLTEDLVRLSHERGFRLYFLGAGVGVAEAARDRSVERYPNARIVGCYSPSPQEVQDVGDELCRRINASRADILLVALGAPKQERWIHAHSDTLTPSLMMGVGASLDFLAGSVQRAPEWMRKTGLEWFYRLSREPGRLWRRYLVRDPRFLFLAVQDALRRRKS